MSPTPCDDARAQVEALQRQTRLWLIMWRPYQRTYSAIYAGDAPTGVIVDADTPDELRQAMATAVFDLWQTSPLRPQSGRAPVRLDEVCQT
ncbi:hypothetical protein ACQP1V_42835 (plasmid) [Microtetraspora malaysiensis]|uniref:hypothetical protein n=1 Tax=Microtetraspora malaysiensis TaxID=161358 RepID=UPI003D8AA720